MLAAAGAASGQEPAKEAQAPDVIDTGERVKEKDVRRFVRALSEVSANSPMERFDRTTIRPAAVRLREARNLAIAERMRLVGRGVERL